MLATIVIISAVGAVASVTLMSAVDSYVDASTQAQLHSELSIAVDRIDRELRRTTRDPIVAGAPNIATVSPTSITWNNNYSLSLSAGQLLFVENGSAAAVMLTDVSAFSVQAFNESNGALAANLAGATCDPIRRLLISVTVQRFGVTETLRTKVYLRCTMEGV
jgi:hypothetical protein